MSAESSVDDLAATLYGAVGLVTRRLRHSPAAGELSLPERSALALLDRQGPATTAALARSEQITPQAVSTTIAGLERRGFVERTPDPDDGRQMIVSLTEAGRQVLQDKRDARIRQLTESLTAGFTPAELATLQTAAPLLERLGQSL
ncbi:MarR family transcriptional regulator [Amycolatopsis ultiminotia]|uniref:MarR family transcriptional regulator n=1 Tax=Amycolatopsis ultiminotia TaxID=543629 RepID=A0ABP6YEQ6_9PSEU